MISNAFMPKKVLMVGVYESDGEQVIYTLNVFYQKGEITSENYRSYESIRAFREDYISEKDRLPIIINLENPNIVLESDKDSLALFEEDEFVHENTLDEQWYGVVRVAVLEELFDEFNEITSSIIQVYLGPIAALGWGLQLFEEKEFQMGQHKVTFIEDQVVLERTDSQARVELNSKSFESPELQLYLSSFQFFLGSYHPIVGVVGENHQEQVFKKVFEKSAIVVPSLLFILFLISTVFFFQFTEKNDLLSQKFADQQAIYAKAQHYRQEIDRLEGILDSEHRRATFTRFGHDLAEILPKNISLTELGIYPVSLSEMKRKKVIRQREEVIIKAQCRSVKEMSHWITDIKALPWVADIIKNEITEEDNLYSLQLILKVANVE